MLATGIGAGTATAGTVAHERGPGSAPGTLNATQIERAEPRSILRQPLSGSAAAAPGPARVVPFTSQLVANPTVYPNSTWGKVFGKIRGVGPYSCSATVVRARNRSVVFTAAHCVRDPGPRGRWAKKFTFIPSYTGGARPFGAWKWKTMFVEKQWVKQGNSNFDYAAVVFKRNNGARLQDQTGALSLAPRVAKRQTYRAAGYPFNKANGEQMWECISGFDRTDPFYRGPGPRPIGIGCDMLGGASGGGWMIDGNRLVSVTSFGYANRPDELYGPRLTNRAEKMRRRAQRE